MTLKSPELHGFHGIIEAAPEVLETLPEPDPDIDQTDRRATAMVPKICAFDSCKSPAHSRGWCRRHYDLWRRNGDPARTIFEPAKICAVESCDSKQHAHGYCDPHLWLYKAYGDPLAEGPGGGVGRNRLDVPSYDGMHTRLFLDRGRARNHSCVDCASQAAHWSYSGGCPNEVLGMRDGTLLAYTTDQSKYSPRCRSCHKKYDDAIIPNASRNRQRRGPDGRFMAA
jgi:hypothetical protein